jgi:hypothetical protein
LHLAEQMSNFAALETPCVLDADLVVRGPDRPGGGGGLTGAVDLVAFVSATSLGVTVLCSIIGLWPQQWDRSGWTLPKLEHMNHSTELPRGPGRKLCQIDHQ